MIYKAKFLSSFECISDAMPSNFSEVAFLGRSNVGKSSLINALCKQKNLAKSSSTPGKTQLINFFEVFYNKEKEKFNIYFIDLPGFGYAKVSKKTKEVWSKNLNEFLRLRTSIKLFILLIDSRHTNLEIDLNVSQYLQTILRNDQKILRVFTKSDKLNQSQKSKIKVNFKDAYLVSSANKEGLAELEKDIILKTLGF